MYHQIHTLGTGFKLVFNKNQWSKPSHGRQLRKLKKGQKTHGSQEPKKDLVLRSYLIHSSFNVVNMQIVRFNNNKRSKARIF